MVENWDQYKDLEYYPDRFCACGCGNRIKVQPHHKYQGIPEYINRHCRRGKGFVEQWVKDMSALLGDIFCACGCGGKIEIKPSHKWDGIPKYIKGHSWRGKKRGSMPEEQRENIRKKLEGKPKTKEHKKKICVGNIGKHDHHGSNNPMYGNGHKIRGKDNPNWRNGSSNLPYPFAFGEELKKSIRDRDDNICQLCSKTKEQEGKNLCVHHIDYVKENLDPSNLITLCNGCNSKVNGNRGYWIGFFKPELLLKVV